MKSAAVLLLALVLTACASSSSSSKATTNQLTQAAETPLSDLNLVKADIPPVLLAAQKAPYAIPPDRSCAVLATEIEALDAVLGADLDTPPTNANPGLVARGTDAAMGVVRGAAEGVVPFRGWVRKLSGAERYSKEVAAAIAAGTIRRAFLKGLGEAAACAAPAAPRRPPSMPGAVSEKTP